MINLFPSTNKQDVSNRANRTRETGEKRRWFVVKFIESTISEVDFNWKNIW
jgi:hypothetical protein